MHIILPDSITSYLQSLDSKKVVIGFSGGPDSIASYKLISDYYLSQNRNRDDIYLAHYNHKFRSESDNEAEYIQNNYHNVFFGEYNGTSNSERDLRIARHSFFKDCMNCIQSKTLILGHNLSDRLETTIMNIQRGAGANGIGNMQEVDEKEYLLDSTYTIIRPILQYPKHHITTYCDNLGLYYFIDKTNTDPNISKRNKIRIELINPLQVGNIKPLYDWRLQYQNTLDISIQNEINELFDHYIMDDTVRDGIRRWYSVLRNHQIVCKPKKLSIPHYFGFKYLYIIPQGISGNEIIYILKGINVFKNIEKNLINELLHFHAYGESGYKNIGDRALYRCHGESFLVVRNSLFDSGQVLQFWLQYDDTLSRLVDLKHDTYNQRPVNKRFINNKIPVFLRHLVPVDNKGNYKDSLIIELLHNTY